MLPRARQTQPAQSNIAIPLTRSSFFTRSDNFWYNNPMLKNKFKICDLFNIPIYVDITFLILLLLFISDFKSFSFGIAAGLSLAISVILHELGHSLTARAFGYHTNDITISLIGGCASLIAMPRKAWQEFLTALAGPMVSFALALMSFLMLAFLPVESRFLIEVLDYVFYMNLVLGIFNMLPGFPMDGGRVFRSFMCAFVARDKATRIAMWVGRVFAILLALRGIHSILSGGAWGFMSLLIAWMIWKEGWREYQQVLAEERWTKWSQGDFNARVSPPPYEQ